VASCEVRHVVASPPRPQTPVSWSVREEDGRRLTERDLRCPLTVCDHEPNSVYAWLLPLQVGMQVSADGIAGFDEGLVELRRRLHRHPELSYAESKTAKVVATELRKLGIEVQEGIGGTGVVGLLETTRPGKVVALRADMDALPIEETSKVSFRSENKGVMHACGHDAHVAMLVGAAKVLVKNKGDLCGSVKFFFQPAEEDLSKGGAKPMIEAGAMDDPHVDYVFGLHIMAYLPAFTIGVKPREFMACADTFRVEVFGKGGHAAAPHETSDPVYIISRIVTELQWIAGRKVDPVKPFVISVGSVHAGTKANVIPSRATLEGTIRTLDDGTRKLAIRSLKKLVESVCRSQGASYELNFADDPYPVTYNDPAVVRRASRVLSAIRGARVRTIDSNLGAEDFSRFLQRAPGMFYHLGTRNPKKGCVYPNHSSDFMIDEDVMRLGSISLAELASEFTRAR
jgi:carboxypeptidase Ss1